jgi:hypothetical protein
LAIQGNYSANPTMKKLLSTIVLLAVSAGLATAGDYYSKAPVSKGPVVVPPPVCPCFDPGVELSLFGSYLVPETDADNEWGGGAGVGMFFTENIGINTSYNAHALDSVLHTITADLVLRMPIHELCIAPYVFAGGGVATNGSTEGLWRVGGGLDVRMDAMGCVGFFVDGSFNWLEGDSHDDGTIVRLGVKIPF